MRSYLLCFGQLGTCLINSPVNRFRALRAYSTRLHLVCTARLSLILPSELSVRLDVAIDRQRVAKQHYWGIKVPSFGLLCCVRI